MAGRTGLGLLLGAVLLPVAILGAGAFLSWRAAWREARTELERTADAAAEYGLRVLAAHGVAAGRVDDLLRGLPDAEIRAREEELHHAIRRLVSELPQAASSFVVDRDGVPLVGGAVFPMPREPVAADRDFFLALRASDAPALHVSRVHRSRASGALFFAVSRRRDGGPAAEGLPPRPFHGVISVSADPAAAAEGLRRLASRDGRDVLGLVLEDGHLLTRTAALPEAPHRLGAGSAFHAAAASGAASGAAAAVHLGADAPGGAPHLAALRRLEGLPVYATAQRPRAAVMARWREMVLPQLAIGTPATLLLLVLALRVRWSERRLLEANATLEGRVAERTAALSELSEALDLTPCLVLGMDGTIHHWSAGCRRLYGFTAEEAVGQVASTLLRTEWPTGGRAGIFQALERDGEWHGELRQRARDGKPILTAAHWILRRDAATGEPAAIVSTRADLTALRRTEDALRATERRLRQAQEASGVAPFEVTAEGLALAGEAHLALYGLPPDARFDFAALLDRVHPEDREMVLADHARLAHEGGVFEREFRVVPPDGTLRWILSRGEAVANPSGGPMPLSMMGVNLDVTARKLAEAALAESEARLRLAQEAAGLGIFDYDYATGRTTWDARLRAIWALPEGTEVTNRVFLEGLHPEDRPLRRAAVASAMRLGGGGTYSVEYRVIGRADGVERWVSVSGGVRFDAAGRPARLVGAALDVTARKRAELRNELLMREVDHRAKNALAVVQAALRLSRAETPAELVRIVEGRVTALARAQTVLAQRRWEGAELRVLLEGELAPFLVADPHGSAAGGAAAAPRATLLGPPVTIGAWAAQPLCMALHELATNAVKYGALSRAGGRLTVAWRLDHAGRLLHIAWREAGGPGIEAPPERRGFGSRVIEQTVRLQLGGSVASLWLPDGLLCELVVPLGRDVKAAAGGQGPTAAAAA